MHLDTNISLDFFMRLYNSCSLPLCRFSKHRRYIYNDEYDAVDGKSSEKLYPKKTSQPFADEACNLYAA